MGMFWSVPVTRWPDECPEFSVWWETYPEQYRVAKGAARREWYKIRPSKPQAARFVDVLIRQKASAKWQAGYVPAPAAWLRDERWEDWVEPAPAAHEPCTHQPPCNSPQWCMVLRARERDEAV